MNRFIELIIMWFAHWWEDLTHVGGRYKPTGRVTGCNFKMRINGGEWKEVNIRYD